MGWAIGIICVIAVIIVGVAIATKADKKRFKEDYQKLSKEEKALITEEEYINAEMPALLIRKQTQKL